MQKYTNSYDIIILMSRLRHYLETGVCRHHYSIKNYLIILCNFRWVRPDIAPCSGAAIIEIDIPTGFYIRKETLRKTMRRETRIPARRFRFTRQTVVLYLDYVSILSFILLQWQLDIQF